VVQLNAQPVYLVVSYIGCNVAFSPKGKKQTFWQDRKRGDVPKVSVPVAPWLAKSGFLLSGKKGSRFAARCLLPCSTALQTTRTFSKMSCCKLFHKQGPLTTIAVINTKTLTVLEAQGKHVEAKRMNQEVFAVWQRVLGREHPETLTTAGPGRRPAHSAPKASTPKPRIVLTQSCRLASTRLPLGKSCEFSVQGSG
jgi:hypothetical protein